MTTEWCWSSKATKTGATLTATPLSLNAFVLSQFELEILHQEIYIETKCDIAVDVFNLGLLAPPPLALGPWIAVCHV